MTRRGHCLPFFVAILIATPLLAQQPTNDDRLRALEQRLDALTKEVADIRGEIASLKGAAPAPPQAESEDLTKIAVPEPPAGEAAGAPPLTDVQTVNNTFNPAASKVFNPDTSVIGNFLGKTGQRNDFEFGANNVRPPMSLDEAEVAFEAFVDPYAKAKFFLAVSREGIEVEEGYANFVNLPYGLTSKVGKMKAAFGKDNTWHAHVRPWADQPLVIHNFFGDEGLSDSGISVSKDFANPWNVFLEGTAEVFSGDVNNVFDRTNTNDLFYNTHFKAFKDISENSNVEVGTSYALGNRDERRNSFCGIDVTYRWKPLQQGLYRSMIARLEAIANHNPASDRNLKGFYTSLDYQFAQRWFAGVRLDSADRGIVAGAAAGDPVRIGVASDRGASATLTFWPSEFSQIRGQLRRTRYGSAKSVTELLFQLQFAIGAHGAHTF
jgi:cell division protein FtsB